MKKKKAKNPKVKMASALKYDVEKDKAPYIVAVGQGYVAEKILEKAEENDVKIVEDKPLAAALQNLSIGDEIPEELYRAVAQILVFISDLDNEYGQNMIKRGR